MPLIATGEIIAAARAAKCGASSFNIIQLEHMEGIIAGAESVSASVILQISENTARYHGSLVPLAVAAMAAAEASSVPVSVHLDHATNKEFVQEAVEIGLSSVMFDASKLPYGRNVETTAEIVTYCHNVGVWVEAELGEVGGKDGAHAPGTRTDPLEAASYAASTGVDALAVAVGTSHAMLRRTAVLDLHLIEEIHSAVPVPLVLHGSSGVSDVGLRAAVDRGITKVNMATQLNQVFTAAVRSSLASEPTSVDTRQYLGAGRAAVIDRVAQLIALLSAPPRWSADHHLSEEPRR
jgi:fructose-bisphosphate aldolase, class II